MTTDWEKIGVGLDKYQWIMQTFKNVDVSKNREFKKRFNHFYKIRQRTPEFYMALYQKLEASKKGESYAGDISTWSEVRIRSYM